MARAALESVIHPFTAFNFVVEIVRDDAASQQGQTHHRTGDKPLVAEEILDPYRDGAGGKRRNHCFICHFRLP